MRKLNSKWTMSSKHVLVLEFYTAEISNEHHQLTWHVEVKCGDTVLFSRGCQKLELAKKWAEDIMVKMAMHTLWDIEGPGDWKGPTSEPNARTSG